MAAAHSREVEAGKCELQHGADTQAGEADVASSESAESAEEYESMPCMGANIRPLHLFSAWCQNFLLWLLGPWQNSPGRPVVRAASRGIWNAQQNAVLPDHCEPWEWFDGLLPLAQGRRISRPF